MHAYACMAGQLHNGWMWYPIVALWWLHLPAFKLHVWYTQFPLSAMTTLQTQLYIYTINIACICYAQTSNLRKPPTIAHVTLYMALWWQLIIRLIVWDNPSDIHFVLKVDGRNDLQVTGNVWKAHDSNNKLNGLHNTRCKGMHHACISAF